MAAQEMPQAGPAPRLVRLQFTDILGSAKEVTLPASGLEQALAQGTVFDGSSIEGFVRTAEADMRLVPDPATAVALPPAVAPGGGELRLLCDIKTADGEPFAGCPRTVLAGQVARAQDRGVALRVSAEVEFFLLDGEGGQGTAAQTRDRAGYFDLGPAAGGEEVRNAIALALVEMGLPVSATHHEVAPGQHEIDLAPAPVVAAADHVASLRWVARTVAHRYGMRATFMPKPWAGVSGSGLHLSLHLERTTATEGELSPEGGHFLAGILAHAPALTALACPLVNSYKRLVPGFEAPLYVTWSSRHRSPLVRVPRVREARCDELEYRAPDAAANPYLTLAALIGCGLWGLEHRWPLPPAVDRSPGRLSPEERRRHDIRRLPTTLAEALAALEADEVVRAVLGEAVVAPLIEARRIEWELYEQAVHDWEREQYLDNP